MGFERLSFTGQADSYAELPLSVLPGATIFTIEAKISTTSTNNRTSNWTWGTIAGREIANNWQDDFGFCVNNGKLCFWAEPKAKNSLTAGTGGVVSNAVVNDGKVHKVAVVSSNSAIYLYCDGELVASKTNVKAKITDSQPILLAQDSNPNSYLQMDLYELRFWNVARTQEQIFTDIDGTETGLQAWYLPSEDGLLDYSGNDRHATLYGSPVYSDSIDVEFKVDTRRKVQNELTTFRYENAGDAGDLLTSNNIRTDLPASQSRFGVAFTQGTAAKCFPIPETYELWAKFDVYINNGEVWCAYNDGSAGICGIKTLQGLGFLDMWQNGRGSYVIGVFSFKARNTVLLHMLSGTTDGVIEVWVNGNYIKKVTGDVNNGNTFDNFYLQSGSSIILFSDVIISNAEIGLDEHCKRVIPVEFTADLQRKIALPVTFSADVQRTPYLPANFNADLSRNVVKTENLSADIQRKVANRVEFSVDAQRKVGNTVEFTVDAQRRVVVPIVEFVVDLRRKITKSVEFTADAQRTLAEGVSFAVDTQRNVVHKINQSVDIQRKLVNVVEVTADVQRRLANVTEFVADLQRSPYYTNNFTVDLQRTPFWQWLTRILPESSFLDPKIYASAVALDYQITKFHQAIREVLFLSRLDELSGTVLDLLAEQFHVDYYDAINFSDEEKRNLIRQSIAWHRLKGTPAAVEMVLQDAFKDLRIEEWFDYGGEPYFFRLWTKGYKSTPERFKSFWLMFIDAKNVRSQLEKVIIDHSHEDPIKLYTGVAKVVSGLKTTGLPRPKDINLKLYTGVATVKTGKKITGLPKPKNIKTKIYSGVLKICTGTIYVGMKRNPF